MRKSIISTIIVLVFASFARAQDYKMALGLRLASDQSIINNSASFKYFLNEREALEGLVSFDKFGIGALYERHRQLGAPGLKWYYGGGAFFSVHPADKFGAMGVLGLDYKFPKLPLNLALDWKPELILVKEVGFEPAAVGITVRFAK